MFDTDEFIDTVQNAKKTMVKAFVQNETIAKSMNVLMHRLLIQKMLLRQLQAQWALFLMK